MTAGTGRSAVRPARSLILLIECPPTTAGLFSKYISQCCYNCSIFVFIYVVPCHFKMKLTITRGRLLSLVLESSVYVCRVANINLRWRPHSASVSMRKIPLTHLLAFVTVALKVKIKGAYSSLQAVLPSPLQEFTYHIVSLPLVIGTACRLILYLYRYLRGGQCTVQC